MKCPAPTLCLLRLQNNFQKSPLTESKKMNRGSHRCFLFHRLLDRRSLFLQNEATAQSLMKKQNFKQWKPSQHPYFHSYSSSSSSSSVKSSKKKGIIDWYLGMLETRPVLTKSLTAGFIYTVADLSSQTITRGSSESFDLIRTLRMAGFGMLIMGPSLHVWYNVVSKVLPKQDMISTLKKMFIGQTVLGPAITTTFFSVNAALQGESGAEIVARLKRDLIPTLKYNLIYWPMYDFVTFKFIPVRLQPLANNSFSYFWTIYLTYMATLEKPDSEK